MNQHTGGEVLCLFAPGALLCGYLLRAWLRGRLAAALSAVRHRHSADGVRSVQRRIRL